MNTKQFESSLMKTSLHQVEAEQCERCIKRAKRFLLLLIAAGLLAVLLIMTGCASQAVHNPDGTFSPPAWTGTVSNAARLAGEGLAPATGGLSLPAGQTIGWLAGLIGASIAAAAAKQSANRGSALNTVNTTLLAHPQGGAIITAIQSRAQVDNTVKTIDQHIG